MDIEDYYADVKTLIASKKCDIHNRHPGIDIINGEVVLDCCCIDFKLTCYKNIINLLNKYRENQLKVVWKKLDNDIKRDTDG